MNQLKMNQIEMAWITTTEAARRKNVSNQTILSAVGRRELESVKMGSIYLIQVTPAFRTWKRDPRGRASAAPAENS